MGESKTMSIHKLVDPGQVYIIGQYEVGTTNPTPFYKIGIVQNERSSEERVNEHQTGYPNRLFIAKKIQCEASYMVEQQMHRKWNGVRIGKEWFNLANPSDLTTVEQDVKNFDAQYGSKIVQLRPIYYTTPTPGDNSTLSSTDRTRAEQIRDNAFVLTERMALLKYLFNTYEFEIKLSNGSQPCMDSVSTAILQPESSEFKDTKLPPALRAQFMNKPQKNKDDFRFNFAGIKANIDDLKLDATYWKKRYPGEFTTWAAAKEAWNLMNITIQSNPRATNFTIRTRTTADEALHKQFIDALDEYERLKVELEVLKLECKILCDSYESIDQVCTWKRGPQANKFNVQEFKLKHPSDYVNPAHYRIKKESVPIKVVPYKTYV